MTTRAYRPRISRSHVERGAPQPVRTGLAAGFFALLALVCIVGALVSDSGLQRIAFGSFAVASALFGWYVAALASAQAPGVVRLAVPGVLRFQPTRTVAVLPWAISVLAIVPGALRIAWVAGEPPARGAGGVWLMIASGAGVIWLGQQLWSLRVPTGLTVTEEGLRGIRSGPATDLTWDELTSVEGLHGSSGPRLMITTSTGALRPVPPYAIGSDPITVAAIVDHFRRNPQDRHVLNSGWDAVRAVEAAGNPKIS